MKMTMMNFRTEDPVIAVDDDGDIWWGYAYSYGTAVWHRPVEEIDIDGEYHTYASRNWVVVSLK